MIKVGDYYIVDIEPPWET